MNPVKSQVHVNKPLTNISIAYLQDANQFVHSRVFPTVPVDKSSDVYFRFNREDFWRNDFRQRAPGTESAGSGFGLDTATYHTKRWDLHKDVADSIRSDTDAPIVMDTAVTEFLTQQSLIQREVQFAGQYMKTGVWTNNFTGVTATPTAGQVYKWNDDSSDPVADITAAATAIHRKTGFRPNKLTLAQDVRDALDSNPAVIDRLKYGQTAGPVKVTDAGLADMFGVDELLVSGAVMNKAAQGAALDTDFVVSGSALLTYSAPTASLMMPSAGYMFTWRGLLGNSEGARIKKFRMENLESDRIELALAYDMKVVGADLGAFLHTLV